MHFNIFRNMFFSSALNKSSQKINIEYRKIPQKYFYYVKLLNW